ncbi:class I SAM-dependent methyltransferase [Nocardia terpenica]|uniref:class I SAM-dependent methyltransferase n=1 Tax=Nocardia terpenica TaxID=455432 RepID=UPI001893604B|nr:class I SAM-dependent methyltransferase [Nocardia terpenica]MBF6065613.1 class I SAM-dependent methyltransferase [Nocardia terpenica]MBF6115615.1 class I SAM-dependent methyltransferase [Nocardia terpenica]MBF6122858.1 class I SAM-dependent methyltransferase [Nocardia terpenica]MBF6155790.1 class I SAM-dependent methyltransferase [Nocardia terpenica]
MNGQPSRTALATAYARAYHQVAAEPRVFTDELAVPIAGIPAAELGETNDSEDEWPRLRRLFLAGRARFAEDTIAEAVADGARQAVILGAGLDTFGCRNPHPGLRVFEVDHPDTQAWKRQRLAEADIAIPTSLTFAPVDFETGTLAAGLAAAGFDRTAPTVFAWMGVVFYLTPETITGTLRFIADQAAPVRVVLDYLYPPATENGAAQAAMTARADRVAALGEPWRSYFTAEEFARVLGDLGYRDIEDRSAPEVLADYMEQPPTYPDSLPRPPHIVRATHRPPSAAGSSTAGADRPDTNR